MRVGSTVYATQQGLGILAKDFYDHGVVTDVVVIRHGKHEERPWYPGSLRIYDVGSQLNELRQFVESMDVMLFFETPFVWELIDHCRAKGVKTALMVMHECLHKNSRRYTPDLFLCPSELDVECVRRFSSDFKFIPVPVTAAWRQRERAEVFVHNAGWGGLRGRNGTADLYKAFEYIKSPVRFILRTQEPIMGNTRSTIIRIGNVTIDYRLGTFPADTLWTEGDVFVFPEKFNGLSLPLQEAFASGMMVMCGDRFPMNTWLPHEPLIPVSGYHKERIGPPYEEYDCAEFLPKTIAVCIDQWNNQPIAQFSSAGRIWANATSWTELKPVYLSALEELRS